MENIHQHSASSLLHNNLSFPTAPVYIALCSRYKSFSWINPFWGGV